MFTVERKNKRIITKCSIECGIYLANGFDIDKSSLSSTAALLENSLVALRPKNKQNKIKKRTCPTCSFDDKNDKTGRPTTTAD